MNSALNGIGLATEQRSEQERKGAKLMLFLTISVAKQQQKATRPCPMNAYHWWNISVKFISFHQSSEF